jgi:hypothetical protein
MGLAHSNAVTFLPQSGRKVFAALTASLAVQGLAGHWIQFEAGYTPSSSPLQPEKMAVLT